MERKRETRRESWYLLNISEIEREWREMGRTRARGRGRGSVRYPPPSGRSVASDWASSVRLSIPRLAASHALTVRLATVAVASTTTTAAQATHPLLIHPHRQG